MRTPLLLEYAVELGICGIVVEAFPEASVRPEIHAIEEQIVVDFFLGLDLLARRRLVELALQSVPSKLPIILVGREEWANVGPPTDWVVNKLVLVLCLRRRIFAEAANIAATACPTQSVEQTPRLATGNSDMKSYCSQANHMCLTSPSWLPSPSIPDSPPESWPSETLMPKDIPLPHPATVGWSEWDMAPAKWQRRALPGSMRGRQGCEEIEPTRLHKTLLPLHRIIRSHDLSGI